MTAATVSCNLRASEHVRKECCSRASTRPSCGHHGVPFVFYSALFHYPATSLNITGDMSVTLECEALKKHRSQHQSSRSVVRVIQPRAVKTAPAIRALVREPPAEAAARANGEACSARGMVRKPCQRQNWPRGPASSRLASSAPEHLFIKHPSCCESCCRA